MAHNRPMVRKLINAKTTEPPKTPTDAEKLVDNCLATVGVGLSTLGAGLVEMVGHK